MATAPPFRADHVGSLLRPKKLLEARAAFASGSLPRERLREIEDEAIREVVRMQEEVGLRSATDGELRRGSWHMDFIYQLGGIVRSKESLKVHFHNQAGDLDFTAPVPYVEGKIRLEHTIFGDDFRKLKELVRTATPKLTIPSLSMVHYRGGRAAIDPAVYPDEDGFWADLSAAYAEQVRGVAALGCTYLQLDDTSFAYLNDPKQRAALRARGDDADKQHLR